MTAFGGGCRPSPSCHDDLCAGMPPCLTCYELDREGNTRMTESCSTTQRHRAALRVRCVFHELRCAECRVTWRGWAKRIVLGDKPPKGWANG